MPPLRNYQRVIDIGLTNRSNARCYFCPRDASPRQCLMTFETYKKAVDRLKALKLRPIVNFAGQGDFLLHRELATFAQYLQR